MTPGLNFKKQLNTSLRARIGLGCSLELSRARPKFRKQLSKVGISQLGCEPGAC